MVLTGSMNLFAPSEDPCSPGFVPLSSAILYVVDNDESVRNGLSCLLRASGWAVKSLASAAEFLNEVDLSGPGCVLLDCELPDTNGIALQAHIRDAGMTLPVIFLTAKGDVPTSVLAMKQGAVDFLLKPVDEAVLFPAIGLAISRHVAELRKRAWRDAAEERIAQLSPREREVLHLVRQGRLNKQIAFELGIAEKALKVHRGRVMEKLAVKTVIDLVHQCELLGDDNAHKPV